MRRCRATRARAGQISKEALADFVDQHRAFAAHGFAYQRHRSRRRVECCRVELHEFEVSQFGAGAGGKRQTLAETTERICSVVIEAADAASGKHDAIGRKYRAGGLARRDDAGDGAVLDEEPARPDIFKHGDGRRGAYGRDQGTDEFAPGRVAAGMNDAPAAVRRFQAEGQAAAGIPIEDDAKPFQPLNGLGRRLDDTPGDRDIAQAVAGVAGIGEV